MDWRIRLYRVARIKEKSRRIEEGVLLSGTGRLIRDAAEHFRSEFIPEVGIKKPGVVLAVLENIVEDENKD